MGFLVLLGVVASFVAVATIPRHIFGPLDRAAKGGRHRAQFTLADFFCLFFLMQVSMGLGHAWPELRGTAEGWVITIYGWIAFGLIWLSSVRKLSRAGVTNTWQRSLYLCLVVPWGALAAVAGPILGAGIFFVLADHESWSSLPLLIVAEAVLLVSAYLLGRLMRRIVNAESIRPADTASGTPKDAEIGGDSAGGPVEAAFLKVAYLLGRLTRRVLNAISISPAQAAIATSEAAANEGDSAGRPMANQTQGSGTPTA